MTYFNRLAFSQGGVIRENRPLALSVETNPSMGEAGAQMPEKKEGTTEDLLKKANAAMADIERLIKPLSKEDKDYLSRSLKNAKETRDLQKNADAAIKQVEELIKPLSNEDKEYLLRTLGEERTRRETSKASEQAPDAPLSFDKDQLIELTVQQAEAIGRARRGRFTTLHRLQTLTPAAAAALVREHRAGDLAFNTMPTLSKEVAEELAKYEGSLSLTGLSSISQEALEALAKLRGKSLDIATATLTPDQARILATFRGEHLTIVRLKSISSDAAKALAEFGGETLNVDLRSLSRQEARELSRFQGDTLWLPSVRALSKDEATCEVLGTRALP
jgi:hypothetical protein